MWAVFLVIFRKLMLVGDCNIYILYSVCFSLDYYKVENFPFVWLCEDTTAGPHSQKYLSTKV